jgi:hypothetical protein
MRSVFFFRRGTDVTAVAWSEWFGLSSASGALSILLGPSVFRAGHQVHQT